MPKSATRLCACRLFGHEDPEPFLHSLLAFVASHTNSIPVHHACGTSVAPDTNAKPSFRALSIGTCNSASFRSPFQACGSFAAQSARSFWAWSRPVTGVPLMDTTFQLFSTPKVSACPFLSTALTATLGLPLAQQPPPLSTSARPTWGVLKLTILMPPLLPASNSTTIVPVTAAAAAAAAPKVASTTSAPSFFAPSSAVFAAASAVFAPDSASATFSSRKLSTDEAAKTTFSSTTAIIPLCSMSSFTCSMFFWVSSHEQ
mmetsp:Transcript_68762/g.197197  ORF Transcript_68762/g.197197 Transcript_68762/m.197197 type:complete len:259 (+) Transcript_68762:72-848(+)